MEWCARANSAAPPSTNHRFARYDPHQSTVTLLGPPYESGGQQAFRYGSETIFMERAFCCAPWAAVGPDRIYITRGDQFVIDVYAFDGTRIDQFSLPHRQPAAVTDEDEAVYYRAYIEPRKERDPTRARLIDRAWAAAEKGSHHMAIQHMFVDEVGYLWLDAGVWARDESLWLVLDPQGREVAAIRPPQGIEWIAHAGQDYVRGGRRGDFDVLHMVIHELIRSPEQ